MYQLMVSYNCGISYAPDQEAETLEELQPRMQELDSRMLRWCVEQDGKDCFEAICDIHAGILAHMETINSASVD